MMKYERDLELHENERKSLGFKRVKSMNAYRYDFSDKFSILMSYDLIVAVLYEGEWFSSPGYHDYSTVTSKQVTKITGYSTTERRKNWRLYNEKVFASSVTRLLNRHFKLNKSLSEVNE